MKNLFKFLLLTLVVIVAYYFILKAKSTIRHNEPYTLNNPKDKSVLQKKAAELKSFASANGYNEELCILINMHISSGKNRLLVYHFQTDSIALASLVAHGRCNERWLEGRKYGNEIGCGCSSLGKYKIGNAYNGKFGLAYKLHGLDKTNSNAFNRFVVLHSHDCVPEDEMFPYPICQSDGCPTVSPKTIASLGKIIDQSAKPMLLYIFDEP
jgi:hypothetical protein